ncbi:MAG TPA: amine oxidase [Chloroflexi bacterium]|jgi:monoamine oxidase|nr:amine oxidase [Chloroflexota bacterium]
MAARDLDVAIVGAGVSGVWCGWRLTGETAGAGQRKRVGVFELSDHVGGRLLSVRLPGLPNVPCELGGMRYMSTQPLVKWLVEEELNLPRIEAPVGLPQNLAYLRGHRLLVKDLTNAKKVPYNLAPDERKHPDQLLQESIDRIAPDAKGKVGDALRKAVRTARFDGHLLSDQGFWNILARTMSHEAFLYAQEAGGYDTTQLNWNAADTVVLNADFAPGVQFTRVASGFEDVPRQLAERFTEQGGELHFGQAVRSVDSVRLADGTVGVALQVENVRTGRTRVVRARSVILAMPRRSLELLDPSGPVLGDPGFRKLLTTVTPIPLFKSFVAYHQPWWETLGITSGRSVTDLPLRQTYYWSSTPKKNSVLLATYDDTLNISFWQGLAGDPRPYGLELDHLPKGARDGIRASKVDDRWMAHRAPTALVDEIHRQLVEMHGVPNAPRPYAAVYHDWADDPFGGGVNWWNIGVKSWRVIPKMAHPVSTIPAYVCGEAYSDTQGWVEGALRTAEIVLTKHLGLAKLPLPPAS